MGIIYVSRHLCNSLEGYITYLKCDLNQVIQDGYRAAADRPTSHLDTGTLEALFCRDRVDRWASLSVTELEEEEEELRPAHYWAAEICHELADRKRPVEEAKAKAKAVCRRPLTHKPFAKAFAKALAA